MGAVLPLTMNFRSGPDLCTWANTVFETCFPKEPTAHAPRFAPLDPKPKQTVRGEVCTLTHHCDKAAEFPSVDAARIAAYIRSEVDAGRRHFSDFLILTRKKVNRIAPYADALEALNIPTEVSGAGAFGESREVEALTKLLRALADPQDPLALVAVLRGPLFGISDPELFAFKQSGGWFSIFQPDEIPGGGPQPPARVRMALDALNKYYRWTRVLPTAGALEQILEGSGYLALAATTPGGVDGGDVLHALDRVRQVVETGGSLADAADALEADREATSEIESLPLEPGRTDVVRLMNLHKAKGLEANVVFLADPAGGVKARADVHIQRDGLQARGWLKIVRESDTSWAETLLRRQRDLLVYVALSRFGRRPKFSDLPNEVRKDVKALLGSYTAACRLGDALLFSCGQRAAIDAECRASVAGKVTPDAIYVHLSALAELSPLLRTYEGCGRALMGAVDGATLIKLRRDKPKVSYLVYPDFDSAGHPQLQATFVADLAKLRTYHRDYSQFQNRPVLHRKETFVSETYPLRSKFEALSAAEDAAGLLDTADNIGFVDQWQERLESRGYVVVDHNLVRM